MERVLSLKLLSKHLSGRTSSFASKTFQFLSQPTTASHHHHGFFSQYSTLSSGQQNQLFSGKIPFEIFTNPVFAKRLFHNTSLKGQSEDLFDRTVVFFRNQISRRKYPSNFQLGFNCGGWQSWFQRFTADDVVKGLIITNVGVFMLWRIANVDFMRNNFMISVDNFKSGRIHTLITSAFSHKDIGHLISNMVGLYFFGTSMGRLFGPQFVLKLYLVGALAGSVFFLAHHGYMSLSSKGTRVFGIDPSRVPGLGASGAVNAIMLLDIFLFPKKTLYFDFIIPVPAVLLGVFLIGKDVYRMLEGDSRISGSAHLGGAAVAALAWLRIRKGHFSL